MRYLSSVLCCVGLAQSALAQCTPDWDTGFGKTLATINKMVEFDDGTGPALYAIGEWANVGGSLTTGVAKLVDGRWEKVGLGLQSGFWIASDVRDMVVYDADGNGPGQPLLVVAGAISYLDEFFSPNPTGVMAWDGSTWQTLGTPYDTLSDIGTSLAVMDTPGGQTLYFGGFNNGNYSGQYGVFQWDGSTWSVVGNQFSPLQYGDFIYSLVVHNDGSGDALYAAGGFTTIDGVSGSRNVAKWNGSQWSKLGTGVTAPSALTKVATFDPDGAGPTPATLVVLDGASLRTWNGTTLSAQFPLSSTCTGTVISATYNDAANARLLIGGNSLCDGSGVVRVMAFDGVSVQDVFEPIRGDWVTYIGRNDLGSGDQLVVAGVMKGTVNAPDSLVAWDGAAFEPTLPAGGAGGNVTSLLAFDPDGPAPARLYAAGTGMNTIGAPEVELPMLGSYNGAAWSPEPGFAGLGFAGIGTLASGPFGGVGTMFASGGDGSSPARAGVARFDGSTWNLVGAAGDFRFISPFRASTIRSVVAINMGGSVGEQLFATGRFNEASGAEARGIARWNGASWEAIPTPPNQESFATFDFDVFGYRATDAGNDRLLAVYNNAPTTWTAALWDGTSWTETGVPSLRVFRLGSDLLSVNDTATYRLQGAVWTPVAPAPPVATFGMAALGSADPGDGRGELAYFTYAPATNFVGEQRLLTFDGATWTNEPVGSFSGLANAVARFDVNGETSVWFAGSFTGVGATPDDTDPYQLGGAVSSRGIARLYCPAPDCVADWDHSGGQPNSSDFLAYLNDYSAQDPAADLAPPGGNGVFDSSDFLAYLNAYSQGC
ncbi:MAG: GC-type dockerin domain-anchored protein [Phycisphaerales bacterium]|jgi:hypothetical protein|nr:GC-type dockerin domain-anchored protein [Phycisphaerales bacterium]